MTGAGPNTPNRSRKGAARLKAGVLLPGCASLEPNRSRKGAARLKDARVVAYTGQTAGTNRSRKGAARLKVYQPGQVAHLRHPNRSRKGAARLKGEYTEGTAFVTPPLTAPERGRHD